jgi:hypothetical protein
MHMSDIGIRLDGLVLLAAVAFGILSYAAIGIVAAIRWITNRTAHARNGRIAAYALATAAIQGLFFATVFIAANSPNTGPDIIDWFSVPYVLACVAGYAALARIA